MPPTPVAAPWYGSTALGWLCDSILKATASPSPIRWTPAFSPGPATTSSPPVGSVARSGRLLLYEQCSLHMTLNIASSRSFGDPAELRLDRDQLLVVEAEGAVERDRNLGHLREPAATSVGPPAAARSPAASTSERRIGSPSAEPSSASAARSGCGMSPATFPAAFITPAMARSEPFGFAGSSESPAGVPSGWT